MRRGTAHLNRHGRTVSAATLTTIVVCLGSAAPAVAAAPSSHHKVVKDPLASARTKALADVTVYGKRLAQVLQSGAANHALSADELLALHDAGVLEGVALRDDRVAISRAKTRKAVVAAVASAQRTVAVASLQLLVATTAEAHLAATAPLADAAAQLSDETTAAAAAGEDTTEVTDGLDAVSIDLESAQSDELTTVSDATDLAANPAPADLKAAAASVADDLALIDQDVSDATDDLATAQSAYDNLDS